jgi:osmotically-inducible protein OsmY
MTRVEGMCRLEAQTGDTMSNALLAYDVFHELLWDPSIDCTRIKASTKDGVVVLTGVVDTYYEKAAAEDDAWRIRGVQAVRNDLVVDTTAGQVLDSELSAAANAGLDANGLVPRGAITIEVSDGWVTMTGNVHHHLQRQAAEHVISHLRGLRGLTNLVTVASEPASDVSGGIVESLTRNATLDASGIKVSDVAGVVTLSGAVRSYAEKQEAERSAWLAPGVVLVKNDLVITV